MKKLLSLILITLSIMVSFAGCFEEKSTYTVLMREDNKPYSYSLSNKVFGLESDIINAVAAEQGFEVNLITDEKSPFTCCASDFTNGSEDYDYTNPFYQRGIVFTTSQSSNISCYEQLVSTTIGVIEGSSGEEFASQIAPQYNLTVKKYRDTQKMYKDAQKDTIAGFFQDELIVREVIKAGENLKTFDNSEKATSLSFAVNKGKNQQFIEDFNEGLEKIMKNGTYKSIIDKY